jgi:hypothetical protein
MGRGLRQYARAWQRSDRIVRETNELCYLELRRLSLLHRTIGTRENDPDALFLKRFARAGVAGGPHAVLI